MLQIIVPSYLLNSLVNKIKYISKALKSCKNQCEYVVTTYKCVSFKYFFSKAQASDPFVCAALVGPSALHYYH